MSNDKPTATLTATCWGCNKSITKPYSDFNSSLIQLENLLKEGWVKRFFGPNACSWFCGHDCAYLSAHAQQAEQWWKEHKQKTFPWFMVLPLVVIMICFVLAVFDIFTR
jgi:hypothetical protein